jgi:hypothetical protein
MPEGYLEAPLAYDAIWAIALGKKMIFFIFLLIKYFLTFTSSPFY